MSAVIIIPARYASSRFLGKPLAPLKGADGAMKPLIQRTWEAATAVRGVSAIYVATDDVRIAECAQGFGADVVMTGEVCRNGTERCAEAIANLDISPDIVVNFQGDAPLTPPWFVEDLIAGLSGKPEFSVATPVLRCDDQARARFVEDRRNGKVGGTTAVFDAGRRALYFSKEVLPFGQADVFHHVGVYAYRPSALEAYATCSEGALERAEGLEQLRFLENGEPILCVEVDARGQSFWELNNPQDIERIEAVL